MSIKILLLSIVIVAAACSRAGEPEASEQADGTEATTTTVEAKVEDEEGPVRAASGQGQLGVCGGDKPSADCFQIVSGDHAVQIAVVNIAESGSIRLLLPGGPGQDLTRSATFNPAEFGAGASKLVVLGEPNSSLTLSESCKQAAQDVVDRIIGTTAETGQTTNLSPRCRSEVVSFGWTTNLLRETATYIGEIGVTEVYGVSFGARVLQALLATDSMSELENVVLLAPSASADATFHDLATQRALRTSDVVCGSGECVGRPADLAENTFYSGLLNISYAWSINEPILQGIGHNSPEYVEAMLTAARGFTFIDPGGDVDPQFVSFLAGQCAAYKGSDETDAQFDSEAPAGFYGILHGLYSLCDEVSGWLEPLPSQPLSTLEDRTVCILFSSNDPVAGRFEADSFGLSPEQVVDAAEHIESGHWPQRLAEELAEGDIECPGQE